jgi:nucleotide-binding universal stress UspA family protein
VIRRILVAYDGSEPARRALEVAAELAAGLGTRVGLVSVAPLEMGPPPDDPWSAASAHAAELHEAKALLAERGLDAETHEPMGEAGPMIVQVAEEFGYDTIVIGSRHLGALGQAVLGSVSVYVANHANATVIIARGAADPR